VFILQVPLIGICFLACIFIRDRGLERPKEPEEIEEEKRKAEAERDAEAAIPEQPLEEETHHQTSNQVEKRPSMSTLAESSMPPSRAEPNHEGVEKQQKH
jgi:hypothetical protein